MATGGEDRQIIIRDFKTGKYVNKFQGHRGGVTGLCFVEGVNSLYSCSLDRTVKVSNLKIILASNEKNLQNKIWSLDEMSYVDTLFGHQSEALAIALLSSAKER